MKQLSTAPYQKAIAQAVTYFWQTRNRQRGNKSRKTDQGNRSAVTGGKQLDAFLSLLVRVAKDLGVSEEYIHSKGNELPGYFRPTKDWDLLIISPQNELIAAVELKSQVGSFGNNFNNRAEEAIGNAVDLWTAFREQSFPQVQAPWLGYFMLVERSAKSEKPVRLKEPHFSVRSEFINSSYLDRYALLCKKLMLEKHYSYAALMWSDPQENYGNLDSALSLDAFLMSFMGHLQSKSTLFL